eukprot:5039783-Prymnesium_polylepis.1
MARWLWGCSTWTCTLGRASKATPRCTRCAVGGRRRAPAAAKPLAWSMAGRRMSLCCTCPLQVGGHVAHDARRVAAHGCVGAAHGC